MSNDFENKTISNTPTTEANMGETPVSFTGSSNSITYIAGIYKSNKKYFVTVLRDRGDSADYYKRVMGAFDIVRVGARKKQLAQKLAEEYFNNKMKMIAQEAKNRQDTVA